MPCAEQLSISHSSLLRDNSSKGSIKTRSLACRPVLFYLGAFSHSSPPALELSLRIGICQLRAPAKLDLTVTTIYSRSFSLSLLLTFRDIMQ